MYDTANYATECLVTRWCAIGIATWKRYTI